MGLDFCIIFRVINGSNMRKSILTLFAFAAMIAFSLAFTKDDPGYKNLKILPKNITPQQMDSVMEHYAKSLGVTCKFCHVGNDATDNWDFASDENKHKLVAREMMRMTDTINDNYFDMTGDKRDLNTPLMVTCFTCHHGKTEPDTKAK
jgi:hypothetical protein